MNDRHRVEIHNPHGEGVFTKVLVDGELQMVSDVLFEATARGGTRVVLTYPFVPVEADVVVEGLVRRYRVQLLIKGWGAVTLQSGEGHTLADALRNLADQIVG